MEPDFQGQLSLLPKRIKGDYLSKKVKTKYYLTTNLFKLEFDHSTTLNIFTVKTNPPIHYNNSALRASIFEKIINIEIFGLGQAVIMENAIIASKTPQITNLSEFQLAIPIQDITYTAQIKFVKKINLEDIYCQNPEKSRICFSFFDKMIKYFLHKAKFQSFGKSKKFFKIDSSQNLSTIGIKLYKGAETSTKLLQNGLYWSIDSCTRVVRDQSGKQYIDYLYKKYRDYQKQQIREKVREQMIKKTVMANYGNKKFYQVEDAVYNINCKQFVLSYQQKEFKENQQNVNTEKNSHNFIYITLKQYYKIKYGLEIKNCKQPVFKFSLNSKKKKGGKSEAMQETQYGFLIPQFCLISGIPQEFNDFKRRQITNRTILKPNLKLERVLQISNCIKKKIQQEFKNNSLKNKLSLDVTMIPQKVQGIKLENPILQIGLQKIIPQQKVSNFQFFENKFFYNKINLSIFLVYPLQSDKIDIIKRLARQTYKNFGINYKLKQQRYERKKTIAAQYLIQKLLKESKYQQNYIFWIILPRQMQKDYQRIKRISLQGNIPKLTQITKQSTLEKKGLNSVITKILIQMATKYGNVPWAPKVSSQIGRQTMIIGIDTTRDSKQNGTIVSFFSSISSNFACYYSNFYLVKQENAYSNEKSGLIIVQSIKAYYEKNQKNPKQIIILKNNCSTSQISKTIQHEIQQALNAMKICQKEGEVPNLTYIIVDKNCSLKLFKQNKENLEISNVPWGTLINSGIVSKNYDFYIAAQSGGLGMVKPVHYNVIYANSKLEEGVLQQFLYTQCFNYMNWTGSVKVPGYLQYAKKLGKLVAQYLHVQKNVDQFKKKFFFI